MERTFSLNTNLPAPVDEMMPTSVFWLDDNILVNERERDNVVILAHKFYFKPCHLLIMEL